MVVVSSAHIASLSVSGQCLSTHPSVHLLFLSSPSALPPSERFFSGPCGCCGEVLSYGCSSLNQRDTGSWCGSLDCCDLCVCSTCSQAHLVVDDTTHTWDIKILLILLFSEVSRSSEHSLCLTVGYGRALISLYATISCPEMK